MIEMLQYTISFTLFGDDNSVNKLTRRVIADSLLSAENTILREYGNSVIFNSISSKEIK